MFAHEFVRNAYLAGTFIALACGVVGWFVVLRGQLFAGDALSHVAFVGAIAAAVVGLDERVGLFVLTLAVAGGMAALGRRGQADDAVIGTVFAWILGIGVLLLAVLATSANGGTGIAAANTLFGSIYSLDPGRLAPGRGDRRWPCRAGVLVAVRPLLLATLDSELAAVRGRSRTRARRRVPRAAGASSRRRARRPSARCCCWACWRRRPAPPTGSPRSPYRGLGLSALLAVLAMWGGLALSYEIASLPPSSAIIGLAGAVYLAATLFARARALTVAALGARPAERPTADDGLGTGWRLRAGVTTRGRRRSPAAGFGESVRKRRGALSSRPASVCPAPSDLRK